MTRQLILPIALLCLAASPCFAADSAGNPAPRLAPSTRPAQDTVVVSDATEAVIDGALRYLASKQNANGAWAGPGGEHSIGITGYTMMAYMAAGHQPGQGPYGQQLSRALEFLLACVHEDGYIGGPYPATSMYEHGIATITLAELYGQTQNPALRPKLSAAVKLIISCQNDQGGWRYRPVKADADISVTVIQVVALRAAKNSGFDVPQETIDKAVEFVKSCADPSGGFSYQPGGGQPGFASAAAAIYSLQVCGHYDDPLVEKGADYLKQTFDKSNEWFSYGNNYAAPAMYMIGGDTWKQWYGLLNRRLMGIVRHEGQLAYWEPVDGQVNAVYATAVYTTILAMPYHYIPLYQR
jgi:hypothetical protein